MAARIDHRLVDQLQRLAQIMRQLFADRAEHFWMQSMHRQRRGCLGGAARHSA